MQKSNLLKQIMAFEFCLVDLTQYLDTHRDDKEKIALFNEYKGVLDELKAKKEEVAKQPKKEAVEKAVKSKGSKGEEL